jgi:3-dehydroquinate synthase
MLAAGEISCAIGLWSRSHQERQRGLVRAAGLPLRLPALDPAAVLDCLQGDKKVRDGKVRFVLPTAIGSVVIREDVEQTVIHAAIAALSEGRAVD